MLPVPADGTAAFAARLAGLVSGEFMGSAARMGNSAALARYLLPSLLGKDRKAAFIFWGEWHVSWCVCFHGVIFCCLSINTWPSHFERSGPQ